MSRRFCVVLEHDGDNPVRNDYICELDDNYYYFLKSWEDLYTSDLDKHSKKKHSRKTLEDSDWYIRFCWDINKLIPRIEGVKQEMEVDTQLGEEDKNSLQGVIDELQRLYNSAMKKCKKHKLNPEKCFLVWWLDF